MKKFLAKLNKAFENRIRLGIMSVLAATDKADFNTLKEMLDVSDGNLASHISALEKVRYILIEKKFIGKKTNTSYAISKEGKKAFSEHLNALEELIRHK